MSDVLNQINAALDETEAVATAATPGPWYYDGYSTVFSAPMLAANDEFWTEERENDDHTYDHRVGQTCPGCGERPAIYGDDALPEFRGKRFGTYWDCARAKDAYDVEPWAARVPTLMGDTARARHAGAAAHIARHDPAAVLRMVAGARAIVALHSTHVEHGFCDVCSRWDDRREAFDDPWPCPTITALAAMFAAEPEQATEARA